MAYVRKTRDVWVLMSNYGYGWDEECWEETWKDAKRVLKEYRENTNGSHYIKKKRERIEQN